MDDSREPFSSYTDYMRNMVSNSLSSATPISFDRDERNYQKIKINEPCGHEFFIIRL